jgi:hypothetical protein
MKRIRLVVNLVMALLVLASLVACQHPMAMGG